MLTLLNVLVKRIQVVTILIALLFLNACKDTDKNSSLIFEELNESLERSNKAIEVSTTETIRDLESKSHMPETGEKASIWLPKAYFVYTKSKEIIVFFDSLKAEIRKGNEQISKRSSQQIYSKLKNFKENVLNCDPEIKKEFENRIIIFNQTFEDRFKDENQFYAFNFNVSGLFKTKSVLSKLENDVRNTENRVVVFCKNHIGMLDGSAYFEKFQPIAAINSSVFKVGQEMVVNVGVGEFKLSSKPAFLINGINVLPNENGVGEYKIKIKKKPGKYFMPVKITYIRQNGQLDSVEKGMEYIVVE